MKITVDVLIDAPVSRVWNAYITPEDITQWNFASDDWCCPSVENDFQVGGRYKARMESVDKKFGFDFVVTYNSIIEHKEIKYSMEDGRTVVITFEDQDNATYVKTVFDAEGENSEEMQKNGWQAILNNFKKYIETKV